MKIKVGIHRRLDRETTSIFEKETDEPVKYLANERNRCQNEYIEIKIGEGIPNTPFMIIEVVNAEMLNEDDLKEIIKGCDDMNKRLEKIFKEKERIANNESDY